MNGLLFELKLSFIRHVLPFAAAASTKMLAKSLHTVFAGLFKGYYFSLAKVFFAAIYLYVYNVAGHGFFYYDRPAYRIEQALDGWQKVWAFLEKHLRA